MFCSVQQNKHTSTEPRSRCQIVAHFFFSKELNHKKKSLHIKFQIVLFVKTALQGLLMNKAQCKDSIYTSEFTDYIAQFHLSSFCLCCNLHSFAILSAVVARLLCCFGPAIIALAVLRDVVDQDLMLVS